MTFYALLKTDIDATLESLKKDGTLPEEVSFDRVVVEPPRDASHGDVTTNAAMVLCKQAKKNPRELAGILAELLKELPTVDSVDIAGPGFINMRLSKSFWHDQMRGILKAGTDFGDSKMGNGEKVNVEYVSANPTGPMHVGHGRGAVFGDVLASLLGKAGYDVTKEYYVNDAGSQIEVLARSLHLRYQEALGVDIGEIPAGLYPGDYLISPAKELADNFGDKYKESDESVWLPIFKHVAIEKMLDLIRDDLAALGIVFDVFSSERDLVTYEKIPAAIEKMDKMGLIYEGVLEPPKGKKPDDWEERPQTLFKATEYGDDVDRPLKKSNGDHTYFAADIAYHFDKIERGFNNMINVWGADHGGYVKRMKAAIKAGTEDKAQLDVKLCQMVNLMDDGQPVKMSKRAGTFVTLREVIDAVGKDVMRFIMLTRKNDAQLDFDLKKVKDQSRDNPVFYVQYAHARAASVKRKALEAFPAEDFSDTALEEADWSLLNDETEDVLMRLLADFPRQVEGAAASHEPHRICYYLQELAAAFHAWWNRGRDDASLRFLMEDDLPLSKARLALVRATATVIASGLAVFGVTPVEEM